MPHFSEWNVSQAQEKIKVIDGTNANKLYYRGDHWQNAAGWPSPRLTDDFSAVQKATSLDAVKSVFTSANKIDEVVGRHLMGILGGEPSYSVTVERELEEDEELSPAEQALVDEATRLLDLWWQSQQGIVVNEHDEIELTVPVEVLKVSTVEALLAERGCFRFRIAPRLVLVGDDGVATIQQADVDTTIQGIYIQAVPATQAILYVDPDTLERGGLFVYEDEDGRQKAELSYLDEAGNTVVRVLSPDGDSTAVLPLGGRLTINQMKRKALITESVRQLQIAINKALTTASKNLDYSFKERIFINVQPPGEWSTDDSGKEVFTPATKPPALGPGQTSFFTALPVYDETSGELKGYTAGSVHFSDPTPPDVYESAKTMYYQAILEEVDQLHVLIAGDATASGVSRQQAKGDFANSLSETKQELDAVLQWILETVLTMAAAFSGQAGRFEELRISADAQIDLGVITPEERAQNNSDYQAGTLSRTSAIRANGVVSNPDEELQVIQREEGQNLERKMLQANIYNTLGSTPGAAQVAEFKEEDQAALVRQDFEPVLNGDNPR